MRFGLFAILPSIFLFLISIAFLGLAVYALILAIKALKIYIYKNS